MRRRLATVAVACLVSAAACGDDGDGGAAGPLVNEIAPAVDAVEAELGGPQEYFEIYADELAVTLWVATDEATKAVPHVYAGGELSAGQGARDASGATFDAADGLDFDAERVLDQVIQDLGDGVVGFSIGVEGETVTYLAIVQSEQGGRLDVRVAPDGEVLEAAPAD